MEGNQAQVIAGQLRALGGKLDELTLQLKIDNPYSFKFQVGQFVEAVRKVPLAARICASLAVAAFSVAAFLPREYRKPAITAAANFLGLAFVFLGGNLNG